MNNQQSIFEHSNDTQPLVDNDYPQATNHFTFQDAYRKETQTTGHGLSVLTIGDPHFRLENITDLNCYISKIVALVRKENPSFVVLLGDILHTHEQIHTTVINKAYSFIYKLSKECPVYVIVGNHDYINNSQFLSDAHWMNAMKMWPNVTICDRGSVHETVFGKFLFCPYVFPGKFKEALSIIDTDWTSARAIFCHQEFQGCKMGAIVSVDGDDWELNNPFIISGHVHDKQLPQANIYYTGSSMQHAFGETHNKTITMCHFDEHIRFEEFDLNLPSKKIIYKSLDEMDNFDVPENQDKYRVTLTGTHDQYKLFKKSTQYKHLVKKGVKIVYKHQPIQETTTLPGAEDFHHILYTLVEREKNPHMLELYNELFSGF